MNTIDPDIRIVFLQRGNILVGRFRREGLLCLIEGGSVIRRWGTTRGIGQLAQDGPTKETTLDPVVLPVEYHQLTEVMNIRCNVEKWRAHVR